VTTNCIQKPRDSYNDKRYTKIKNFTDGVRGYLFQGRFTSCVLDERHLVAAVRYVECNPVRAGIAKSPWDYTWSSAAFHVGNRGSDMLVRDRTLLGLIDDWREFLGNAQDLPAEELRQATRTGRPAGDAHFTEIIERLTNRTLRKKKPGKHPKKPR